MKDIEIIRIIAEQLTNEFPGQIITDVEEKAERLYKIMRLKESLSEIENAKKILQKLINDL